MSTSSKLRPALDADDDDDEPAAGEDAAPPGPGGPRETDVESPLPEPAVARVGASAVRAPACRPAGRGRAHGAPALSVSANMCVKREEEERGGTHRRR
jgi:hypothetical protein